MTIHLTNPRHVSFANGVITPRWLYVLTRATPQVRAAGATVMFRNAIERLISVLSDHNAKEEPILYPMTDRAVATPAERDALVRQMQAI